MNEAEYTASEASFARHLRQLRLQRRKRKEVTRATRPARKLLSVSERKQILAKTAGRCHICGGNIGKLAWHADHVLAHSAGAPTARTTTFRRMRSATTTAGITLPRSSSKS